jgi:hypothetical protein
MEKYGGTRQATDDNMTLHVHFVCCIAKAANTHSEYVTLPTLPWQQWFLERALVLRYPLLRLLYRL